MYTHMHTCTYEYNSKLCLKAFTQTLFHISSCLYFNESNGGQWSVMSLMLNHKTVKEVWTG